MHEYSIVASLVDRVQRELDAHPGAIARRIHVRIGESAGVEVELLRTAYDTFRPRSACERAEITIATVATEWRCRVCDRTRWMRDPELVDHEVEALTKIARQRVHVQATGQATAREIEDLLDHARHSTGARGHAVEDANRRRVAIRRPLTEKSRAHVDRRERIS